MTLPPFETIAACVLAAAVLTLIAFLLWWGAASNYRDETVGFEDPDAPPTEPSALDLEWRAMQEARKRHPSSFFDQDN